MNRRQIPERRGVSASAGTVAAVFPARLSRGRAWAAVLSALVLTGLMDAVTGREMWFGPFYLATIGTATWFLGRREAVAIGVGALAMNLGVNGFSLYPFGTLAAAWNLAMRITTVIAFIGLLGHLRLSYAREWRLARTDPLTGALNRQAFFELVAASRRSTDWTLLAYADLDGLKKLNDLQGHAAGDEALIAFVAHVRSVIRRNDHFARVGGDEFIVHLKVRDEAAARMVADRLYLDMNAVAAGAHAGLRCSLGALILPPGERGLDREVLAADGLMYEAKHERAGLVVATLREIRGSRFLLQHWTTAAGGGNEVMGERFASLERGVLDTAA